QRSRWALLGAAALITSALQAGTTPPATAAPPVTIRVPLVAEAGQVPPAVVAGGHAGDTYKVVRVGGARVLRGTLSPLKARKADAWASFGLADLSSLGAGTYVVKADGKTSRQFTVADAAYADVLASLLGIFDANADGDEPSTYHAPSHLNDATSTIRNGPHAGDTIDVAGGWMDAGDQLKFTTTIGYASVMLELAARNEPSMADELTSTSDVGIRWLVKAHPRAGVFASMVGEAEVDHNTGWRDPALDDESDDPGLAHRTTAVFTATSGGSDAAGTVAAALAYAAGRSAGAERTSLLAQSTDWLAEAETLDAPWKNCCYPGETYQDDLALAEAALWRVTGEESYATQALADLQDVTGNGEYGWLITASGYEMAAIAAGELCGVLGAPAAPEAVSAPACDILDAGGRAAIDRVRRQTAFGRAGDNVWGSVRESEAGALTAVLADRAGLAGAGPAALRGLGWFLGVNPWGRRWEVGVPGGTRNPHHWIRGLGTVGQPVGAVPGGPTTVAQYADSPWIDRHPGRYDTKLQYYADDVDDYIANEIGLQYNAPAVLHFALISSG
ncbi:MAG TPA: glycoside hydrolase family 9 protein, partial [Nocardioides sp.]|nr:glycoside hydrolase family 9 protein [Nocardioides sp.]